QRYGMVLWDEVFFEVARDYPEVKTDRELVDAVTTRMVLKPGTLDTLVATNLHADILSDLAGALTGSMCIAHSAILTREGHSQSPRCSGLRVHERDPVRAAVRHELPGAHAHAGPEADRETRQAGGARRGEGHLGQAGRPRGDERCAALGRPRLRHRRRPVAD